MPATLDRTRERLERLEALVASLDERLQSLERPAAPAAASPAATGPGLPVPGRSPASTAGSPVDPAGVLTLVGRTFVVLAGAYLLRAVAESGAVPAELGAWLGMAYAGAWLVQADRSAAAGRRPSSLFHGGTAMLIALPLLAEATTRFHFIAPAGAAAGLLVATALALLVARRRDLQGLAWMATLGAVATCGVLVVRTQEVASFSVYLILLGVATLWLGYERDWFGLRWVTGPAADLGVLALTLRALAPTTGERPATAIAVQLLLLAAFLATVTVRTLVRGRSVIPFEVVQTAAALAVGLGGAVSIARATGAGDLLLGASTTVFAVGCYVVALLDRQRSRPANFFFYSTLGLVLMMVGTGMVLPAELTAFTWLALAVLAAWAGPPFARVPLIVHATAYAVAAAVVGGGTGMAATALLGSASGPWPAVTPPALAVVVAVTLCGLGPVATDSRIGGYLLRTCRVVLAVLLVSLLGGIVIAVAGRAVAMRPDRTLDPGVLATLRTVVLSLSALMLAVAGRSERLRELGWLLYPVLAATALKLVSEDIGQSPPAMLFVALAAYGSALIVAPRLARRADGRPAPPRED